MAHRENVEIKTKYKSVEECVLQCRDVKRKNCFESLFKRELFGEIFADRSFNLRSRKKGSYYFEFVGRIEERGDGIYMVGKIQPKRTFHVVLYGVILFFITLGLFLIASLQQIPVLIGFFFLAIGGLYVMILKKFDGLYKDLMRKLS